MYIWGGMVANRRLLLCFRVPRRDERFRTDIVGRRCGMTDNSERQKVLDSFVHQHNYEKRLLGDSYNFDTKHDHILYSAETAKDSWEEKRKKVQNKIKRLNREIEKLTKEINSLKSLEKGFTYSRDVDRKSTRLNSSHVRISYAVFCLKKKK